MCPWAARQAAIVATLSAAVTSAAGARADGRTTHVCVVDDECGSGRACLDGACVDDDCEVRGGCGHVRVPVSLGYAHGFTSSETFGAGHVFSVAGEVGLQVAFTPGGVPIGGEEDTVHGAVLEIVVGAQGGHYYVPPGRRGSGRFTRDDPFGYDGEVLVVRPMVRLGWELDVYERRAPGARDQPGLGLQLLYGAGVEHRAADELLGGTGFAHGPVAQLALLRLRRDEALDGAPFVRLGLTHTPERDLAEPCPAGHACITVVEATFTGSLTVALTAGLTLH